MAGNVSFCTSEDGVRIAYAVDGDGPTTILAFPAYNESFALEHLMPVYGQFYRDLGVGRRVVRFDGRGTGLSSSGPPGSGARSLVGDVEAVVRAVRGAVVLWPPTVSGPLAIEFAAGHSEFVTGLILYGTYATVADAFSATTLNALRDLATANWMVAAQTIADLNGRREFPVEAGQLGDWYFQSETAERYNARMATPGTRVDEKALAGIQAPTLVLHRIADPAIPFSAGQKLAAGIPGARLVPLAGVGHLFCLGDYSNILAAIDAFLGDRPSTSQSAPPATRDGAFRTVLFTDIVGHTEMMQRLGDDRGRDLLREHERITRETLKAHAGAEVKTMGDGFMASFGSVTKAMDCAIALQRAFASHTESMPEPLNVRVGLNAGEPIEEDGDLFGATVILASRIAAKAGGGEILVPDTVRGLLSGKGFAFTQRGDVALKGFDEPLRLYQVRWRE